MRFSEALRKPGLQAIAEVKRRSPSAGDLRPDADPAELAAAFERAGAAAVSILVDERFGGLTDDLRAARAATDVPLLAKGFFSTREQLEEMRGAVDAEGGEVAGVEANGVGAQRCSSLHLVLIVRLDKHIHPERSSSLH